jgi:alanine racemase
MLTVVKADGYGHGLAQSARAAREGGAEWLGVATIDEALAVRATGDTGRLLCWLTTPGDDLAAAIAADVDVTVYSVAELDALAEAGEGPRVQIKVDTGLSRGGAPREEWQSLFDAAAAHERAGRVRITGIWSHFAASDEPEHPANDAQEVAFHEALALAAGAGLDPEVRHLANSAAAILRPSSRFDLVRVGIASYGLDPAPGRTPDLGLVPAMTVRGRLALVKHIGAGAGVSYGHTWVADRDTTVGLVPMGYGDGLPRRASNRAHAWVGGRRRPVRGLVCMDQIVIDLDGDVPQIGDEVVVFGPGLAGEPTAQDWAEAADTINYEIVTQVGGRLVRRHVDTDNQERQ